jgi:hypothetical protein
MGGEIAKLSALGISISKKFYLNKSFDINIKVQHFDDLSVYSDHNCIINGISSILYKIISTWITNRIFDDKLS